MTYATCVIGFGFMADTMADIEEHREVLPASIRTVVVGAKKLIFSLPRSYPARVQCMVLVLPPWILL
jgi:hypothetical protein